MDFIFIAFFFCFPIIIFPLMRTAGLSFFRISIPSVVIGAIFIFAYAGLLPLYFGWDLYRYLSGIQDKTRIFQMLFCSSWTILTMILGCIFARYCLYFGRINDSFNTARKLNKKETLALTLILFFIIAILGLYLSKIPRVALFVALTEGAQEAKRFRSLMGNAFAGNYHWYRLIMRDLLNFVSYSFFVNWLIVKSKKAFYLFSLSFFLAAFSLTMATEKAPFGWFIISLFLLYVLVRKNGILRPKSIMKITTLVMLFLILFYTFFMGTENIMKSTKSIFSRAFTGSISPAYYYLEYFPEHHDFLKGKSFPNPGGILPYQPFRLTVEIMNWRHPDLAKKGIVGSAPTVYWAETYANFGYWGVALIPFFVGIGLYIVAFLVSRLENTPLRLAFFMWLVMHYKNLAITGISGFMIDIGLIVMLGIVFICISLTNHGKIKYRKRKQKQVPILNPTRD